MRRGKAHSSPPIFAGFIFQQSGISMVSGTKFGRWQQQGKSIFPLPARQSFPQRLALAEVLLVIEGVVKEHCIGCCLQ
jgi:hypothetical protein